MKRSDEATLGVIAFATVLGLGVRLAVVATAGFPLNDGGLFYAMIGDLASNQLVLPATTTYNAASIPFAYPPFAFFFYALFNLATRISVLQLMQYGPAIVSCASIPAFYFLALDMLDSKAQATLATFAFALTPRAFEWLIMGGGVTRSFGMLFAILAMRQAYRLFATKNIRALLPLVVLGSLVVYSHPEAATHTVIAAVVFYLFKDRSRRGVFRGLIAAIGVTVLTSPWWASVLARHGLDPFLAAAAAARQDSYNVAVGLLAFLRFQFADEPFLSILSVLGLVGIFVLLAKRRFLLPIWLLGMHALEPRGGTLFMMIPLAMCVGVALEAALLPALRLSAMASPDRTLDPAAEAPAAWLHQLLRGVPVRLFLGFLLIYAIAAAYITAWTIADEFTLSRGDLAAMAWARDATGPQSRFAMVTQGLPLRDASSEWFPAVTRRGSIATVFGFEWIRSVDFGRRIDQYRALQACSAGNAVCLENWSRNFGASLDYVYVTSPAGAASPALVASLGASADYQLMYSNGRVSIFRKRQ